MDDLFAALARFLRERNTQLTVAAPRPVPEGVAVHCRYCGRRILDGEGLFDMAQLRADRACVEHYIPF